MSKQKVRVDTYKVYLRCDRPSCGCLMEFTGTVYATNPPLYQHKDICGHTQNEKEKYPILVYEEVETDR